MKRLSVIVAVMGLGACATPTSVPEMVDMSIVDALDGHYDNYLQVWLARQAEGSVPPAHAAVSLRRINLSDGIGTTLVATHNNGDAAATHRLLQLSPAAGGGWLQFAYHLDAADADADELPRTGHRTDPACDARWIRDGDAWVARPAGGAKCALGGATEWRLEADGLTLGGVDAAVLELRRARQFSGWMGVKRQRWEPDAADDAWVFMSKFKVHSEGQKVRLVEKDGTPTGFAIQLESLVYQNTETPVLKLGLIEEASEKTITYVWANPDATRLGMNLRWFQAGLTAIEP